MYIYIYSLALEIHTLFVFLIEMMWRLLLLHFFGAEYRWGVCRKIAEDNFSIDAFSKLCDSYFM